MFTHRKTTAKLFLALALATPLITAHSARAQVGYITIRVSAADLNLRSNAGQATLHGRILNAARKACGEPQPFGPLEDDGYRACLKTAVKSTDGMVQALIAAAPSDNRVAMVSAPPGEH
jgi:UrcA family protein